MLKILEEVFPHYNKARARELRRLRHSRSASMSRSFSSGAASSGARNTSDMSDQSLEQDRAASSDHVTEKSANDTEHLQRGDDVTGAHPTSTPAESAGTRVQNQQNGDEKTVGETANGLKQADAEPSANSEAMTGASPSESSQQTDVQPAAAICSQTSSMDSSSGSGRMYRMLYGNYTDTNSTCYCSSQPSPKSTSSSTCCYTGQGTYKARHVIVEIFVLVVFKNDIPVHVHVQYICQCAT